MADTPRHKVQELTRAELEIMQILWKIKKGFVNDILVELPEPKPAYQLSYVYSREKIL